MDESAYHQTAPETCYNGDIYETVCILHYNRMMEMKEKTSININRTLSNNIRFYMLHIRDMHESMPPVLFNDMNQKF